MNDAPVAHAETNVAHTAGIIDKKGEIITLRILNFNHRAELNHLGCVSWQLSSANLIGGLHKARAVNAKDGASTPKVWRPQEHRGTLNGIS